MYSGGIKGIFLENQDIEESCADEGCDVQGKCDFGTLLYITIKRKQLLFVTNIESKYIQYIKYIRQERKPNPVLNLASQIAGVAKSCLANQLQFFAI